MKLAGHVAHMGERRGVYRVLVGKLEGERALGRPRRRWEDNIKMDLQEVGCGDMDWLNQWEITEIAQPGYRNPVNRCQGLVCSLLSRTAINSMDCRVQEALSLLRV